MTTMFPLLVWQPGTLQASVPANDNALRVEVLHRGATSILSAPPVSPVDGEVYILGPAPTGAWAGFMAHDVVMWRDGTWMRFLPFTGWVKQVGAELRRFDGAAWVVVTGGGGGGVSSVALAVPAGFSVTGSPVTASGTLTISYGAGFQGFTTAESVKLAGIATSATANATDAALRDRNTHTGTQAISTVTGLQVALDGKANLSGAAFTGAVSATSFSTSGTAGAKYGIGNDTSLHDVDIANTAALVGAQNPTLGYLSFGNTNGCTIGFDGGKFVLNQSEVWHSGNSAQVLAGTANGQIMVWNHATGRVEPAAPGVEMADWRGSLRDTPLHIRLIDYTFTINDRGTKVMKNAAGAVTYTIPTGLPQGMTLVVRNKSASGNITVARAAGVVLRIAGSGVDQNCAVAPWGEALLHHEENNEWVISGTGVT